MNKFKIVYKLIFHFLNILIIILSIYPGSLLGCYLFNDCNYDPQITKDFIVSTNHLYAFSILTLFGILAYDKNSNIKHINNFIFHPYTFTTNRTISNGVSNNRASFFIG